MLIDDKLEYCKYCKYNLTFCLYFDYVRKYVMTYSVRCANYYHLFHKPEGRTELTDALPCAYDMCNTSLEHSNVKWTLHFTGLVSTSLLIVESLYVAFLGLAYSEHY